MVALFFDRALVAASKEFGNRTMQIVYGLLALFFLVLFHEWGHYVAARFFGVTVEAFSLGFGPVLLHKKVGNTDYRLSLFPLGGYCALKGERDFERALDKGLAQIDGAPDSLYGINPLKRAAIGFAGPFFNVLFAYFALVVISAIGYDYCAYSNKVIMADELLPDTKSAAHAAGLQTGDVITQINEFSINNFSDITECVILRGGEDLTIKVLRDATPLVFTVHSDIDKTDGSGKIGVAADKDTLSLYEVPGIHSPWVIFDGAKSLVDVFRITFKGIAILFKGANVTDSISGPAGIVDTIGSIATTSFAASIRIGVVNLMRILSYISVSLFVMNLLPIPILDGSIILFAVVEAVSRRKPSPKFLFRLQLVGVAIIVLLFAVGIMGDIKHFSKH